MTLAPSPRVVTRSCLLTRAIVALLLLPSCGSSPSGGGATPPQGHADAGTGKDAAVDAHANPDAPGASDTATSGDDAPAGDDAAAAPDADVTSDDGGASASDGGPTAPPPADELPACQHTVPIANSAALAAALPTAQPGDCLTLADGSYTFPTVTAKGTAAAPIVVRAMNRLMATLSSGNLELQNAAYVVVEGLAFTSTGTISLTDTDHGRISRFRIQRSEANAASQAHDLAWITVFGKSDSCRIDHNDFGPQSAPGNMVLTTGTETTPVMATHTRIDHNHFHDVHFSGGNGWETIRSGADTLSYGSSFTVIEHNLFTNDANDPEIVSLKSSDNTLRYNTLRGSKGQFNLRSGNRDIVYGNYIFGDGVAGSLGLRVGGAGHKIYNNYIEGVGAPGIFLEGGDIQEPTGTLPVPCTAAQCDPRFTVTKTDVVFNTVVGSGGIVLGGGGHPLDPQDCNVAYNLVQGPGALYSMTAGSRNITFTGNLGTMGTAGVATGVKIVDAMLMKVGGAYAIGAGSPAVNAGMSSFSYVTEDIQGKPRSDGMPDVGANEVSSQPALYAPLTPADVGPLAP